MLDLEMPDLPAFMVRARGESIAVPVTTALARPWVMPPLPPRHMTPGAKDQLCRTIACAVREGADTFGKIAKALPTIDPKRLRKGLRLAIRAHLVEKSGRRYSRTVTP